MVMMVYVVVDKSGVVLSYHWSMEDALYHAPEGCTVFLDKVENLIYERSDRIL